MKLQSVLAALILFASGAFIASVMPLTSSAQVETAKGASEKKVFENPEVELALIKLKGSLPGRYQMVPHSPSNSNVTTVYVCDTTTGECWGEQNGGRWFKLGTPTDEEEALDLKPAPTAKPPVKESNSIEFEPTK